MSDELGLLEMLDRGTSRSLTAYAAAYQERPAVEEDKWHVCLQTPLLGQAHYSFNDLDSLRRELSRALPKLVMGKVYVYYGRMLPVFSDGIGGHLFITAEDGREIPITEGYNDRIPVGDNGFSSAPLRLNIDKLV